ncbi:MAG: nitroreductase family protein [Clostridia bacterium]|nr:nitroreductase family protein [Clostridia bacterium]
MTLNELIEGRYSCRNYADTPVDKKLVEEICLTAVKAPSACNSQPWKIHAFCGEKKDALAQALTDAGLNKHAMQAPVLLAIEETQAQYLARLQGKVAPNRWAKCDIGILTAHLVLLAKQKGLDSCIIGYSNPEKVKSVLNTQNEIPLFITLGYAKEDDTMPEKRRKNVEDVFVWEE